MNIAGLLIYKLQNNLTLEQAVAQLKEVAREYAVKDRFEVHYLLNQNQPQELVTVTFWQNMEKMEAAAKWTADNKVLERIPNITVDWERAYMFQVVKEFQRYHLTAESASVILYRKINPATSQEEAVKSAVARSKIPIAWPGLVHYRLGRCLNNPDFLFTCNNWQNTQSHNEYLEQHALDYRNWLQSAGFEYIYMATDQIDVYTHNEITPIKVKIMG